MKRLLIVHPKQFGSNTDYISYSKYLKPYYQVTFICLFQELPELKPEGINIRYIYSRKRNCLNLIYFAINCIKEINANSYDVIFVSYFKTVFLLPLFAKKKNLILDIRTGEITKNILRMKSLNFWIYLNSLLFKQITVISESLRDMLGLNKSKTSILPLGANIVNFHKEFDKMNLLYIGTLSFRNIHQTVIGYSNFISKYGNIIASKYDIVGSGTKEEENLLIATIKKYKLEKRITFHGRKSHNELLPFLEKANIGVSYVPLYECFDCQPITKTFEYALAGMPCIATETGESKKVISAENGILCKDTPEGFAEALKKIYNNLGKYDSSNIIRSLSDYSWEKIVVNKLKIILDSLT